MKANMKLLALLCALGSGAAGAASTNTMTLAGTEITNQAQATFTVGGATQTTNSDAVKIVVNAVPSYTITNDGTEASPAYTSTVNVNSNATYSYSVKNTGNTPIQVAVGATVGTGSSAITQVNYSGAATGTVPTSGAATIQTITINPDQTVTLTQTFVTPAAPGTYYVNPTGVSMQYASVAANPDGSALTTATLDQTSNRTDVNNVNKTTVLTNVPLLGSPTLTNTVVPSSPNPLPPTGTTTPGNGTGPVGSGNGPAESTGPAYTGIGSTSGTQPPVVVDASGNQYAYPKADAETVNPDSVTMTTIITNPNPTAATYELVPDLSGLPAGVTVTFTDANGNPLPDTDNNGRPEVTAGPNGGTATYRVVVTYPDTESAAAVAGPIRIPVGVDGNRDGIVDATVTYNVLLSNLKFGNTNGTALGVSDVPVTRTVTQPSVTTAVVFPMDLFNDGAYDGNYALSGSTPIGPVKYYATNPDTDGDGVLSPAEFAALPAEITSTGAVPVKTEKTVYAVVTIPAGQAPGDYMVTQTATGSLSGTTKSFNTDKVTVTSPNGSLLIAKRVTTPGTTTPSLNATANPGDAVSYTVTATNNYNTSLYGLVLRDPSSNNLGSFSSSNVFGFIKPSSLRATVSGVSGATVLYRTSNLNTWAAQPTVDANTTWVEVGVDTNNNSQIDSGDVFPPNAVITLTLQGTVK